jgi:hypothetical protein
VSSLLLLKTDHPELYFRRTGTGEHGVGVGKKQFLVDELGDGTIELMKTIKKVIDPYNLFNPGKVGRSYAGFDIRSDGFLGLALP